MPNIRFARFIFIESIPQGQHQSGRQLHEALTALAGDLEIPITVEHNPVSSRAEFEELLEAVLIDCEQTNRVTLLHIECHGNDDGIGLANADFMDWEQLCEHFVKINMATRLNLFVSVAACFGAYLASQFVPTQRAPV